MTLKIYVCICVCLVQVHVCVQVIVVTLRPKNNLTYHSQECHTPLIGLEPTN